MKKFLTACISILFVMVLSRPTLAQDAKMIAPFPPDSNPGSLFGQNQWYSVVFRGNGEAVVNLRLIFVNNETTPMKSIALRVPRVQPTELQGFQVIRQGQCAQYGVRPTESTGLYRQPPCLVYQEPDMYNWYGPAKYQKTTAAYSGDTMTITLPQAIQPEKTGSVLLYYRATGYAKKDLVGAYRFVFETLRAESPVNELQVGISTDSDLILRGTKGQVNYRFDDVNMAAKGMAEMSAPATNTRMDTYYQQIGYGQLVKNASNLQALESYTVKGSYADTSIKLYAKEIGIGIGIFILVLLVIVWIVRSMTKGTGGQPTNKATPIVSMFGLSFLSGVLIVGYTVLLVFLTRNLSSVVEYDVQLPVTILLLIISLGVYGLLLFGPAVFLGLKYGLGFGLGTAGLSIGWLMLTLMLYVILGLSGRSYPMPQMMDSLKQSIGSPPVQVEPMEGFPSNPQ